LINLRIRVTSVLITGLIAFSLINVQFLPVDFIYRPTVLHTIRAM